MSESLAELAGVAGILPGFHDMNNHWRETTDETRLALLSAMGIDADGEVEIRMALEAIAEDKRRHPLGQWQVVEADTSPAIEIADDTDWHLLLEDGSEIEGRGTGRFPALPIGRHRVYVGDAPTWLLSAPPTLPTPARGWGITLPLAGLRGEGKAGFGDYGDLETAACALAQRGAGFVGINPVHAGFPADRNEFSPYAPSHRRRFNIMHLRCPEPSLPLPEGRVVNFGRLNPLKRANLSSAFESFEDSGGSDDFEDYLSAEGTSLELFSTHQALSDRFGAYWRDWPAEFRDPASDAVKAAMRDHACEMRFHAWLQWQAELQLKKTSDSLRRSGASHGLYLDIAVGTHPWGAETWIEREVFATGASLGAPPDAFSSEGQVWGLAPFNPLALARDGFRALAETLRKQLHFARLLRIDHILGFERAFWIPVGGGIPGAYVRMPREAMLAVVRMEAARADATIVGEDLGNIPDGLQDALAHSGIFGCRVVMFENRVAQGGGFVSPCDYPEATLASFGTHDLPTWLGWRRCADIRARLELGIMSRDAADWATGVRGSEVAAFDTAADIAEGTDIDNADRMHAFLGSVASRLVALQIEDILEVEPQPNLPGTVHEYPNWRQRLPVGADEFAGDPRIERAALIMKTAGR